MRQLSVGREISVSNNAGAPVGRAERMIGAPWRSPQIRHDRQIQLDMALEN
jgi:hypothetical protein